jgi:hypothetical protein
MSLIVSAAGTFAKRTENLCTEVTLFYFTGPLDSLKR